MGLEDIFSSKTNSDVKREIVLELLDTEKNLDEKTELTKPMRWSCLKSIEEFVEDKGLKKSATILHKFIRQSQKYLISKSRKGRAEYIESLKALSNLDEEGKNPGETTTSMGM